MKDVPIFELVKAFYAYKKYVLRNSPEVSSEEEEKEEKVVKPISTASMKV